LGQIEASSNPAGSLPSGDEGAKVAGIESQAHYGKYPRSADASFNFGAFHAVLFIA